MADKNLPRLVQGGMGVNVSCSHLAAAVAKFDGTVGVVSGVGVADLLVRQLQDGGDRAAEIVGALHRFPDIPAIRPIINRYYLPNGRQPGVPYALSPRLNVNRATDAHREAEMLTVAGAYALVAVAKRRLADSRDGLAPSGGLIGINLLTKIQPPTVATLYGAMLAEVDYVIMGAGVPSTIPAVLDRLAENEAAAIALDVAGATRPWYAGFDPTGYPMLRRQGLLFRPRFLAIIAATVLATRLAGDPATRPDGFVIEGPTAGGHNAAPRGKARDGDTPLYDRRDEVDLARVAATGLPFWLAGGYGSPDGLRAALAAGAAGVQVGSLFALCDESGMDSRLKAELLWRIAVVGGIGVRTSLSASPTGYPFKVAELDGTLADRAVYDARPRCCDLRYLVSAYEDRGRVRWRCPAEPGGTDGSVCLCNGLFATAGMPQNRRNGFSEPPVITLGDDVTRAVLEITARLGRFNYSAADVVKYLTDTVEDGRG